MSGIVTGISAWAIPILFGIVGTLMLFSGKRYFEVFVEGARSGARSAIGLFPTLLLLLVAVSLFRTSGLSEAVASALAPYSERIGLPSTLLPLLITRPVSGGAANATFSELLHAVSPDSFDGFCASVIMGAGDTLVYVVSVYSSAAGVRRQGKTLFYAFLVMLFGIFFSAYISRLWFNMGSPR